MGLLGCALGLSGCGNEREGTVEGTTKGGGRSRLDMIKNKTEELQSKRQKKS
jgi:hypothetical protein